SVAGAKDFRLLQRTNFPLGLSAYGGRQLTLRLEYDTGRYDRGAATRILGQLHVLLDGMARSPHSRLGDLSLLTPAEQGLLRELNDTKHPYPEHRCVHELFEEQVEKDPEAVAVVFKGRRLTYRELNAQANRLAHDLRGRGVGRDTLVGLCVERSAEMVLGILA